jgi:hypothetical protein
MKKLIANALRSPKTTAAGLAAILGVAFAAYSNPALLLDPKTLATVITGVGLIVARDQPPTLPLP